ESSFSSNAFTPAGQSDLAASCAFAWLESATTRQDAATNVQKERAMESGKDYLQRVVQRIAEFTSRLAAALQLGYCICAASCSRMAARFGFDSSTGRTGSMAIRSMRSIAFLIVNDFGSSSEFTSSQSNGIETVAPGSGRALKGATIVCP